MMIVFLIITIVLLVRFIWKEHENAIDSKIPPGPFKLPIVGNLFQISKVDSLPHKALAQLAKKHGDIMGIKIGSMDAVVLSSYEAVRDLLPHPCLVDRIVDGLILDRNMGRQNLGINWSNGKTWKKMRTFTQKALKKYGYSKSSSSMEKGIYEELKDFIAVLSAKIDQNSGLILLMDNLFDLTGVNIMLNFITGTRLNHNDLKLQQLFQLSSDSDKATNLGSSLTIAFPFLRIIFPRATGRTLMLEASEKLYQFSQDLMKEHRKRGDYATNPLSFVDKFLAKIEEDSVKKIPEFTENQFIITLLDMIQGGSDPISNTLNFAILYMVVNTEVQEKVHTEIDKVVPRSILPSLKHKQSLIYIQATLLETIRFGMVLPIPAARQVTSDFYHRGYLFKKGVAVMANLYAVFHDKNIWKDPEKFRPERFLDENFKLVQENKKRILAFGLGIRNCPAAKLSENCLFLYFTTLMQKFRFEKVSSEELPTVDPVLGMTLSPKPNQKVLVKVRHE